jgi:hypothetical protein
MEATSHTPSRESLAVHQTSQQQHTQVTQVAQVAPTVRPVPPEALARSLYGKLRAEGLTETDIMALVGELMGLVTAEMRSNSSEG